MIKKKYVAVPSESTRKRPRVPSDKDTDLRARLSEMKYQGEMKALKEDARAEGRAEGRAEERQKIAKQLIEQGISADKVTLATGLTDAEVQALIVSMSIPK